MLIRIKAVYLIGSAIAALLLIFFILFVYGSQHTLPRGVIISGWSLGGMDLTQFDLQLKKTMTLIEKQQVLFACESKSGQKLSAACEPIRQGQWSSSKITFEKLGVETNLTEIKASIHSLQAGGWFKRAWTRWQLTGTHYSVDFRIEESKLTDTLNREWSKALSFQPINAYRIVEPNDSIRIIPEINAYQIDMNEVKKRLKLSFPATSDPWLKKLKENIPLHLRIELPLTEVKPAVTSLSLNNQGISRKISQFTTKILTSGAGRIHNISFSAQTMQNQLLAPGEIFDYSQIIRQTEKTYGYQEAPVIYNGKLVPGIGGGICQVSSTLYNAVLRAGLQIIERRNHSLPVSYVPLGQDATYATGYINFRFRNSSDHYILIRSYVEGDALTIKLFGSIPQEKTYEITSHVVKMLLPSTRFLLNSALAANERQTLQIGKIGYIVETYRFQRQAGVLTNKELVSRDTYAAQPSLVAVGKGVQVKLEPDKAPLLEDGVIGPVF